MGTVDASKRGARGTAKTYILICRQETEKERERGERGAGREGERKIL